MGIFSRIKDIASSNITDIKDRGDKSEEKIKEYLTERTIELADIKKSVAELMAIEVRLDRECIECQGQIERFENLAKKALAAGSEEDARTFLKKKHELEQKKADLDQKHAEAQANADSVKETYNAMVREINELQTKLKLLKGREAAADAAITYGKMSGNSDIDSEFDKLERTADSKSAAAEAEKYAQEGELSREIEKLREQMENDR